MTSEAPFMQDSAVEEETEETDIAKTKNGLWKPQVHFVWDVLLDELLSEQDTAKGSFPEFFRILVDGT